MLWVGFGVLFAAWMAFEVKAVKRAAARDKELWTELAKRAAERARDTWPT